VFFGLREPSFLVRRPCGTAAFQNYADNIGCICLICDRIAASVFANVQCYATISASQGGGRQPGRIKGSDMSAFKVASAALLFVAIWIGTPTDASARGRLYPVTMCGPDLAELCPIHGYFDLAPFHYSLAVYPGCIQVRRVETPEGVRLRRVLVCG
jgi:hypothetical protein